MSKTVRFCSAISLSALASVLAGCAAPDSRVASASRLGDKVQESDIGLATRALAALNSGDAGAAITFAERAVDKSPQAASLRALLGNTYFAAGRFASAETAYRDSLSLVSNQPQLILKLALVQIAQGKADESLTYLEAGRNYLDPADYGLALALAGRAPHAVAALETAARAPRADARVRQNLALAYALAGDWDNARVVAAQDVSPDQLDARIQQWMQLASPARASDQVAALTGVNPAQVDPGQPVRLALRQADTRQAQAPAAPQVVAASVSAPPQPAPAPAPALEAAPEQQFAYVEVPSAVEAPPPPPPPPPAVERAPEPAPAPMTIAQAVAASPEAPAAFAAMVADTAPPKPRARPAKVHRASAPATRAPVQKAATHRGKSGAVVQLGAYGSRERVSVAWDQITKRYPALRAYPPMIARFNSGKGMVYRLSIKGFDSQHEAIARCNLLKRRGGSCFVRNSAGDMPVQYAAR